MEEKTSKFSVGAVAFAFGNIARNRYRCPPQLLTQAVQLVPGKLLCCSIDFDCKFHRFLPDAQILEGC